MQFIVQPFSLCLRFSTGCLESKHHIFPKNRMKYFLFFAQFMYKRWHTNRLHVMYIIHIIRGHYYVSKVAIESLLWQMYCDKIFSEGAFLLLCNCVSMKDV